MKKMGGMMSMLEKLPGAKNLPDHIKNQVDDKMFVKMEAIINSMTLKERANPDIIKGSRRRRIALGSGTQVQDVNKLLKQFDEMQRMMKKMRKGGMAKMMRGMQGLMGGGWTRIKWTRRYIQTLIRKKQQKRIKNAVETFLFSTAFFYLRIIPY